MPPTDDDGVPAFWRALGLPGLADIHVHFLPPRMLRGVAPAYLDEAGPLVGVTWPIRYRWTDGERIAHLAAMGVRMFSALAYSHRRDMAEDLNDWTLAFAKATPGCLPSGDVLPRARGTRLRSAGRRRWGGHLHPPPGWRLPARASQLDAVWGAAGRSGRPPW